MFTSKENYINWVNDRTSIKLRTSEMLENGVSYAQTDRTIK